MPSRCIVRDHSSLGGIQLTGLAQHWWDVNSEPSIKPRHNSIRKEVYKKRGERSFNLRLVPCECLFTVSVPKSTDQDSCPSLT